MKQYKQYNWQLEAKSYFEYTPGPKQWFEFIGWITALSTLKFLVEITNSLYLQIIYYVSYAVLFSHIQKVLWMAKYQSYLPVWLSKSNKAIVTYFLGAVIVVFSYLLTFNIMKDIARGLHIQLPLS